MKYYTVHSLYKFISYLSTIMQCLCVSSMAFFNLSFRWLLRCWRTDCYSWYMPWWILLSSWYRPKHFLPMSHRIFQIWSVPRVICRLHRMYQWLLLWFAWPRQSHSKSLGNNLWTSLRVYCPWILKLEQIYIYIYTLSFNPMQRLATDNIWYFII